MSLGVVTSPTVEPLTTAEARAQVRIDHNEEDDLIDRCIASARQQVETITRRALVNTTFDETFDCFPLEIRPARSPLSSVTSITYLDEDGASQTLNTDVYDVDTDAVPGRIFLKYNQVWPTTRAIRNAVTVRFVAGYGSASSSIPAALRSAVALLAAHYYELREPVVVGTIVSAVPMSVESLLWSYRVLEAA